MTKCPNREDLQRFADGEMKGGRRSRIAEHIKSCELCADDIGQLQRLSELISSAIRKETESRDLAGLWEKVSVGIASPSVGATSRQSLLSLFWKPAAKVAYAALVVLVGGLFVVRPMLYSTGPRVTISRAKVYSVYQYDPDVTVSMIMATGGQSDIVWISGPGRTEEN
ncbi:hypothetical protein HQ563_12545 [bacterium]|nr:hypothetical protein [bacterium]